MDKMTRHCDVEGCSNPHWGLGYCMKHYARFKRNGHPGLVRPGGPCSVDGCNRRRYTSGFCKLHYRRWQQNGDPLVRGFVGSVAGDPVPRFWSKVQKSDGCWDWIGGTSKGGYGHFWLGGKTVLAHRYSYELNVGLIPDRLTLDHLCRNQKCVNPAHLEPVTLAENIRRVNGTKTHCTHGHEFTSENTYIHPKRKTRHCKACAKLRSSGLQSG